MIFLLAVFSANAVVRTVNNGIVSGGQYTSAQAAIDASAAGDTVYVHGSKTSYGDVTLRKRIVLIGAGHTLNDTQFNMKSEFRTISLNQSTSITLATGSVIKGFRFSQINGTGGSMNVDNITIERCDGSSIQVSGNGWLIRNNISTSIYINNFSNVIVNNNLLYYLDRSDKPSVLISNNIILSKYEPSVSYANITNNIFMRPESSFGQKTDNKQNTFNKNIFVYDDPLKFINLVFPGHSSSGSLNTADAQFATGINPNPDPNYSSTVTNNDWHLLSTSVGKNYGTDGTDVGIYGGSDPMPNMSGTTNIPQMISVDIQNSVIPQNGTLNVEIKARSQN